MKTYQCILLVLILIATGCIREKKNNENNDQGYYIEKSLSFFDPYEINYSDGKHQGTIYETWIRQPKNLRMIHETFKKVDYHNIISDYDLTSNPSLLWGYVNRPLNNIIDSLILTYPLDLIETKYYREFWQRRKNEQNDEVTYDILQELSAILIKDRPVEYADSLVNDTLYNLVIIDSRMNPTREQAKKDFEYLNSIGMYGSAYNLLFENHAYQNINWDRDQLLKNLKSDTVRCCPQTWIIDDSK